MSNCADAAARAVRHVAVNRQHDGRPVERVDQLRRDDADDAAVPALAGDHEHGLRADVRIGLDDLLGGGEDGGFLFAPADVLRVELHGQRAGFVAQRFVARQQQARGDIGRAHAAGGVDARRQHERDVIAVDRLAGEARDVEQRSQADLVRALRVSRSRPILAMTRFSPTSGTTSASVPMAAILTNPGSQLSRPGRSAECLHHLQRDADAGERLVRVGAVAPLGIDDRQGATAARRPARGGR